MTLTQIIKRSCTESCNQGRSCADLGVCQDRTPPCEGCDTLHYLPTGMAYPFAPGVIDTGEADAGSAEPTLLGDIKNLAFIAAVVGVLAFLGGVAAGWFK